LFIERYFYTSNILELGQDTVNNICDDEDIKAISFVGSNPVSNFCLYVVLFVVDRSMDAFTSQF